MHQVKSTLLMSAPLLSRFGPARARNAGSSAVYPGFKFYYISRPCK